MFNKLVLMFATIAIFAVVPALAVPVGCNKWKPVGTYTRADTAGAHSFVYQLQLHNDGTAWMIETAAYDYMINYGTNSPNIGSWKCREDGMVVVSVLKGLLYPIIAGTAGDLPYADVSLEQHLKTTYLFLVDGPNTITQTQSRGRTYGPAEDPTDPAGGVLGTLRTTPRVYTRYAASDVDLLLP